jgi:hypothetical protein
MSGRGRIRRQRHGGAARKAREKARIVQELIAEGWARHAEGCSARFAHDPPYPCRCGWDLYLMDLGITCRAEPSRGLRSCDASRAVPSLRGGFVPATCDRP